MDSIKVTLDPPYTVDKLAKGLAILASIYPNLWVKPVISLDSKYALIETAGMPLSVFSRFTDKDKKELQELGWATSEHKGKYYWYLAVPDDPRI